MQSTTADAQTRLIEWAIITKHFIFTCWFKLLFIFLSTRCHQRVMNPFYKLHLAFTTRRYKLDMNHDVDAVNTIFNFIKLKNSWLHFWFILDERRSFPTCGDKLRKMFPLFGSAIMCEQTFSVTTFNKSTDPPSVMITCLLSFIFEPANAQSETYMWKKFHACFFSTVLFPDWRLPHIHTDVKLVTAKMFKKNDKSDWDWTKSQLFIQSHVWY